MKKPTLAVHKFTSCDGCQLAFLNAGEALLALAERVEFVHFVELGKTNPEALVDIAFVEGSITTPEEETRIQQIRQNSRHVITIGACATAGGIQALRNFADHESWMSAIYASPAYIETLKTSSAIARHILVDVELWGCPVNTRQVMDAITSLLLHAPPRIRRDAVCLECKRGGKVCVLVTKKAPCLGPVTQAGCGALCPGIGRACYGCYGPSENPNPEALGNWFVEKHAMSAEAVSAGFQHINSQAKAFYDASQYFKGIRIVRE